MILSPKIERNTKIHESTATGVTTSKGTWTGIQLLEFEWAEETAADCLWKHRWLKEKQPAQSWLARRNTAGQQLLSVNISLQFGRVLISLLDNDTWHYSYMTCIQAMAIKVWSGKHLEREKSHPPSRRSGHTVTFWSPQKNYRSLGMAKQWMNRQAWQTHNLKSMVWFRLIKNKVREKRRHLW